MSAACIVLSAHANPATEYRRRTSQLKSVFTSVAWAGIHPKWCPAIHPKWCLSSRRIANVILTAPVADFVPRPQTNAPLGR